MEETRISEEATQAGDEPKAGDGKTFSQKEVDSMVAARLSRLETKHKRDLERAVQDGIQSWRTEHEIDDDTLEGLKNRDSANAELRKLKSAATKATNDAEGWRAKYEKAAGRLREALTRDAVMREAASKSPDPELVWMLVEKNLTVDEDYQVIAQLDGKECTIADVVTHALTTRPHLAKAPPIVGGSGGTQGLPPRPQDKAPDYGNREVRTANLRSALGG